MFRPVTISADELQEGAVSIFVVNDRPHPVKSLKLRMVVQKYAEAAPCSDDTFGAGVSAEAHTAANVLTLPLAAILDRCKFREFAHLEERALREKEEDDARAKAMAEGQAVPPADKLSMADEMEVPEEEDQAMKVCPSLSI